VKCVGGTQGKSSCSRIIGVSGELFLISKVKTSNNGRRRAHGNKNCGLSIGLIENLEV
jgi:hypothetical protein